MNLEQGYSQIAALLSSAKKAVVLIGTDSTDDISAGLSLGLSLENAGKEVAYFTPQLPNYKLNNIVGQERLRADFGQKDLVVLLDYPLDKIEKVSSQEEGDRLRLVVKVKPEADPIKGQQVKIVSQDIDYEVGILIGDESTFPQLSSISHRGHWIVINRQEGSNWAQIELTEADSCFSEIVARLIQNAGLPLDRTIAGNLFEGIKRGTNSFEQLSSYKTLETAALCLKLAQGNGKSVEKTITEEIDRFSSSRAVEEVEKKEGNTGNLPSPRIFRGATTPRA